VVFSIGKDFAIVDAGGKTTQIHRMIGVEYEVRLTGRIPSKLKSAFVRVITHAAGGDYVSLPADLPSAYADITDTGGLNRDRLYQGSSCVEFAGTPSAIEGAYCQPIPPRCLHEDLFYLFAGYIGTNAQYERRRPGHVRRRHACAAHDRVPPIRGIRWSAALRRAGGDNVLAGGGHFGFLHPIARWTAAAG
jgi:hypothetical protein